MLVIQFTSIDRIKFWYYLGFKRDKENTLFWSLRCHLLSEAESYICSANATNLTLLFEAPFTILYHMFMRSFKWGKVVHLQCKRYQRGTSCLRHYLQFDITCSCVSYTRPLAHHKNKSNSLEHRL